MSNTPSREERSAPTLRFSDPDEDSRRRRKKRSGGTQHDPSKLTESALREAALRYLDKQDASVAQLRGVLQRRVVRYAPAEEREAPRRLIDELVQRFVDSQLLDDQRYARGLSESLRRRGGSSRKIRARLVQRGLAEDHIEDALSNIEEGELSELSAARTFARKRRLKERFELSDPRERNKALASLARQGFSFEVAKRALDL